MKLLTRTTLVYVTLTVTVFALGSWLFYSFLTDLMQEEATELLEVKKELVLAEMEADSMIRPGLFDHHVYVAEGSVQERIADTVAYDEFMEEELPFRALHFPFEKNGVDYHVTIYQPLLETEDLQEGMMSSFFAALAILVVLIILFMWISSRIIWKPFFNVLSELKGFSPGRKQALSLPQTRVEEFRELNAAIKKMSANTEAAFQTLKSFSENAAHEIQTPLAVIQSTTEVLLQDEKLTEEQYRAISDLSSTTARLSNIVSTLLLLTRIENQQFRQDTPIDFTAVVRDKMELFRELFEQRGIFPKSEVEQNVPVKLHRVLAEILVSNLLVNAVRHTAQDGKAEVLLTKHEFTVRNSGQPLHGDSSRIFERFYKEDQSELSTGLGLSLVKMVADVSGLHVVYHYENGMHVFSVQF